MGRSLPRVRGLPLPGAGGNMGAGGNSSLPTHRTRPVTAPRSDPASADRKAVPPVPTAAAPQAARPINAPCPIPCHSVLREGLRRPVAVRAFSRLRRRCRVDSRCFMTRLPAIAVPAWRDTPRREASPPGWRQPVPDLRLPQRRASNKRYAAGMVEVGGNPAAWRPSPGRLHMARQESQGQGKLFVSLRFPVGRQNLTFRPTESRSASPLPVMSLPSRK